MEAAAAAEGGMKAESGKRKDSIIDATRHRARGAKTDDDDDFPTTSSRQIIATWNQGVESQWFPAKSLPRGITQMS